MNSAKEVASTLAWTESIERGARQVQVIRDRRFAGDQDLAFGARPFILCGMPIRRLPKGNLSYRRRNGKFFLEIVGHPEWGVPFGQDRLVLLYLATNAIRHKTPTVWFRSGAEILVEWGMPTNGAHYARLLEAFQRVFGSTMFFGSSDEQRETKVWECSRIHFFDSMKLWISNKDGKSGPLRDNSVTLSPEFWHELKEHPIPVDAEVVRMLARNPGCLDLYTWLTWRCHQAKRAERIPLFGPFGLAAQLGVQSYTRERKFRERIRSWLKLVRIYWPECPATTSSNGAFLEVNHASAVMPQQQSFLSSSSQSNLTAC
jgi:hypothetical protein